ncbi:MAG: hypothetical protein ACQCN6_00500 [Candidatus Bathyarchaeia archaeon]
MVMEDKYGTPLTVNQVFAFSIVVVAENRLYTTTTSRSCRALYFGKGFNFGLQAGCADFCKQNSSFGLCSG